MEWRMKKLTFASIVSACMVPILFYSQESSAIPAFARKYQTSCFTCHSGFPTRNAFGEAFRNNGYRWPGGEDEEHTKQEQLKMGADGWKKTFPSSPWPTDIPGFAPLALWVRGNVVNYSEAVKNPAGTVVTPETLNYGTGPLGTATLFFGGTMGDNFSAFGQYNLSAATTAPTGHVIWAFAPGVNLSLGNGFTDFAFGSAISTYTGVFPSTTLSNGAEFTYAAGEKTGGVKIFAGLAQAGTANTNKIDDIKYVRVKYKIGGAGLLSGAGGVYGNEYVGLDNHLAIGATLVSAQKKVLTTTSAVNYAGETLVYGADLTGNVGNFTGGVAVSKDQDLDLTNLRVDAGYFVYPWMKAAVVYTSLRDGENPTLATSLTSYLRANLSLAATYTYRTKERLTPTSNTQPDTFNVQASWSF